MRQKKDEKKKKKVFIVVSGSKQKTKKDPRWGKNCVANWSNQTQMFKTYLLPRGRLKVVTLLTRDTVLSLIYAPGASFKLK